MVKNDKKYNNKIAKGQGRRHSQTTHAAKLRWNAAKQSRVGNSATVKIIIIILNPRKNEGGRN